MAGYSIEIYTVTKDSGLYIPFFLDHYKSRFPNCIINIYNNGIPDTMLKLCKENQCNIIPWGPYSEKKLQITKNTCWQKSKADWVIVCDIDEIVDVTLADIEALPEDVNIITFCGYQMLSRKYTAVPLEDLTHGNLDTGYSKYVMFKPAFKRVIYDMGAHTARLSGITSKKVFNLLHYNQGYLKHINNSKMRHFKYRNITKVL